MTFLVTEYAAMGFMCWMLLIYALIGQNLTFNEAGAALKPSIQLLSSQSTFSLGDKLTIRCSANQSHNTAVTFLLYKNYTVHIAEKHLDVNQTSADFVVSLTATYEEMYHCFYRMENGLSSTWSETVYIKAATEESSVTKFSELPLKDIIYGGVIGGALLLFIILVIVLYIKNRKPVSHVKQNPQTERKFNSYVEIQVCEFSSTKKRYKEEPVYMNVPIRGSKKHSQNGKKSSKMFK
ncbi:uncharacterized protein LOC120542664 [Polypterus senegalus]|uniref:uncharacterized protein LOC120542664 n=1 Tax=Polypterus senegalus TaxID=55291 RepID=UPI00196561C9|nr:uncharacterized protein LOC120542664 [Polypterus senegalus]